MTNGWLTAYATRKLVADRREAWLSGAVDDVEFAIIDYARTVLPARCLYMWDKTLHDDGRVDTIEASHTNVPSWVWCLTDEMKVDWATGIFHLAGDQEGKMKYVKLQGVEFSALDVNQIWPDTNESSGLLAIGVPTKPKGGAQPKIEVWHNFWMQAMKMLHAGELFDAERFPSQRSLSDELLSRINDNLSSDSVKPLVARIWHTFREPSGE